MKKKRALITGINGQDGSYLAELLLNKNYTVLGIFRRHSVCETQTSRIEHLINKIEGIYGDLLDSASILKAVKTFKPDEIYNLAAQSHVKLSFDLPSYTIKTITEGTLNILETIRLTDPKIKLYQACSSEMFGNSMDKDGFQRETTPMDPTSPYACAKLFSFNLCNTYKKAYSLFISSGILFNHESPRRGTTFVTAKVVNGAVSIKMGLSDKLLLGNLKTYRDWGHAKDYVKAMWLMLQQPDPDNFVCATGKAHSVEDLCKYVFSSLNMDYQKYVVISEKYLRPNELNYLRGDASKAKKLLNWEPEYTFEMVIDDMLQHYQKLYQQPPLTGKRGLPHRKAKIKNE